MKKYLIFMVLILAVFLGGCESINKMFVTKTEYIVPTPPEELYQCPKAKLPEGNYTQKDVAFYLIELHANNTVCRQSILEVRKFLDNAKETLEKKND